MISAVASDAWKMNPGTAANKAVAANAIGVGRFSRLSTIKTVTNRSSAHRSDTSRCTIMFDPIHASAPWMSR